MTQSYSMTDEQEAEIQTREDGTAVVTIKSKSALKPRAVYVGEASLECSWIHTQHGSHWSFTPTLLNPKAAAYTQTSNGESQITQVEVDRLFPASGLIGANVSGEIRVPAIQFDLPYASDLWVFILRSPVTPLKVQADKQTLSIVHGVAQAMAQIESSGFSDEQLLRGYITTHGDDFRRVWVELKRNTKYAHTEQVLCELSYGRGTDSFSWAPTVRSFDAVLVTSPTMYASQFVDFLKTLGAEGQSGLLPSLNGDFVLCDGSAIEYTLTLKGEKRFIGTEQDKTALQLVNGV